MSRVHPSGEQQLVDDNQDDFHNLQREGSIVGGQSAVGRNTASHIVSNTSKTSSSLSALTGKSAFGSFISTLFSIIVTFRPKESLNNTSSKVLWAAIFHIYLIYNSIVVSSFSLPLAREGESLAWGKTGSWVYRILFFPINFGCEFYPYEVIVALSIFFIILEVITLAGMYWCKWASQKGGRIYENVKKGLYSIIVFYRTFSLFIMCIHALLIAPHFRTLTSYYYPSVSYESLSNIVFVCMGCLGSLLTLTCSSIGIYLTIETIPPTSYKSFFSLNLIYPFCLLFVSNQVSILLSIVCGEPYSFIASIVKILMSIFVFFMLIRTLPFFRKWENCFYLGVAGSKILAPVIPLIGHFVTDNQNFEVVGGVMTAMMFIAALLGFVIAIVISYIYITFQLKQIREMIKSKSEASSLLQYLEKSKSLQERVAFFIRFALVATRKEVMEGSDFDLAKYFVMNHAKNMASPEMLIMSATFVAFGSLEEYDLSQSCSIGLILLQKAIKSSPSTINIFHIMLRIEELEHAAYHGNNLEVLRRLGVLEKRVAILGRAHKTFFKELLNEKAQIDKLENINRTCCLVYNDCDNIYENLLTMNRTNKTLLRSYASYLEKYKWEFTRAQEYYDEAQEYDDEKRPLGKKKNVYQQPSMAESRLSMEKITAFDDNNWESVSVAAENEANDSENIVRSAINTPMNTAMYSTAFILYCLISVSAVCIIAPMAVSFSSSIDVRMSMQEKVCLMTVVPYKFLSQIRAIQTEYIQKNGFISDQLKNSTYAQTSLMLELVNEVISAGTKGKLMPEVVDEYLKQAYTINIPIKNLNSSATGIPGQTATNTSISFYIGTVFAQGKEIVKQFDDISQLSTNLDSNYPFLFFYYNRIGMTNAFDGFCKTFVNASIVSLDENFLILCITAGSIAGVYLLITCIYLTLMYMHTKRVAMEVDKIFRKIPKDEVGKVYHNFDKKIDDTMASTTSSLLKPNRLVMMYGILICIFVCVCISLILVEYRQNSTRASLSMKNLSIINSVLLKVSRVNFRLNEMIMKSKYMPSSNTELKTMCADDVQDIQSDWYSLILGNSDSSYKSEIVGKYEDIDKKLSNTCASNHSLILNFNSTDSNECYGLNTFITEFVSRSTELNEDYYNQVRSTSEATGLYFDKLFFLSQVLTQQLKNFVSAVVFHEKNAQIYLTATSVALSFVVSVILTLFCYNALNSFWRERYCLRMLLNYIDLEVIEGNSILKDYVIMNTITKTNTTSKLLSRLSKVRNSDEEDPFSMAKTILNSGVDAGIICNKNGDITVFNNSAEEMFAYDRSQVLGLSVGSLVTEEFALRITKLITTTESMGLTDSFEATGLRKNKSTFSAKVSVSIILYDDKPILIIFVRDVTPEKKQNILIAEEKKKSEDLLLNILPQSMASRLMNGEQNLYEKFNDISVFFSDMVGFTSMSSGMQPSELVQMLNLIVQGYDKLTEIHGIDKIKTIGDAYFCVGGLHASKSSDHPERMLKFSIDVLSFLKNVNDNSNYKQVNIRIGIHTGEAVAGVIGSKKFAYDLWGDTINTASRMESTGVPGRIQISRTTYERVYDLGFEFEEKEQYVKGKGTMKCYLMAAKHHENPLTVVETPQVSTEEKQNEEVSEKTESDVICK